MHLGKEIATWEPKQYLGVGNLLNGAMNKGQPIDHAEKLKMADSLYVGPAGSALGAGRMLNDGTLDRTSPGGYSAGNTNRMSPMHSQAYTE